MATIDSTGPEHGEALLRNAAQAYTTRRVPREAMRWLIRDAAPRPGDLVLARVETIGHHKRLQLVHGARRQLFVGDLVIVAYGDRYASSQFEALVPRDLGACHLAASGGLASRVSACHARIRRGATALQPLGLVASEPEAPPLNVAGWSLATPVPVSRAPVPPLMMVVGTAMDSGKTTAAAHLVLGLRRRGLRVGYAKATGTGAAGDPMLLADAGAEPVLDFTDVGYVSTYRLGARIVESIFSDLVSLQSAAGVDAIVVEVADGLLQKETAALLESGSVSRLVDGIVFAASESMGALAGARWLLERELPLRAISGRLTASPLQVREAQQATRLPVYRLEELRDPATAAKLLELDGPLASQASR